MTRHWEPGVAYSTGEVLEYQGQRYKVIQGHTSQSDWTPGAATAALFQQTGSDDHCEPAKQDHECHHGHPQGVKHSPASNDPIRSPTADSSDFIPVPAQCTDPPRSTPFQSRGAWLQEARQRTEEFHRNGPRAPTTWVIASGHDIPDNAIEGGSEGGRTLHIARAYIEDGLYVGKAGKHLIQGAEIGRQHKAYAFREYEILIGDPRAVRWVETHGVPNPHNFAARHVDAGVDAHGHQVFIAQVSHNGGTHPARANGGTSGAYLAYGEGELVFQEYLVLCYA